MKWLQDNPLGMALAGLSGVFVLLAAVMAVLWTLPVSVDTAEVNTEENTGGDAVLIAHTADDLSEFQVINEKPVFNESRLPVIDPLDDELEEDATVAVKDAPDVKLTGVIITPSVRIASLTPADGNLKSVMAHEGQPLTGDYVGWLVSSVSPRNVVLESRDGQKLELDLQVHDATIKEPPKPEPVAKTEPDRDGQPRGEDGEPLSRAEQIRQRIAERREELRREQEDQQFNDGRAGGQPERDRPSQRQPGANNQQTSEPQDYQSAIRALMNNKPKDQASNDKNDG